MAQVNWVIPSESNMHQEPRHDRQQVCVLALRFPGMVPRRNFARHRRSVQTRWSGFICALG